MNDIESSTTATVPSYPKGKVIALYGVLGGAVGGLIIASYTSVRSVIERGASIHEVADIIVVLSVATVFGSILGLLPALLTGYIAYKLELYFDSIRKVLPLFVIGFMCTFLCVFWYILGSYSTDSAINIILICCIGGTSAIVTGLVALPKNK
ncbi:hypothetical protein [Psychrobacter sp.]|uniref:hypothetical protein n=1 Tax=Psychrobacter sp. TaxID=56811 RepID=UPI00264A2B9B|nr:hypothetical protein [Psychrobacter sp.]MDN6275105.1 hypothetical protein [Psychrobacter sp.]MDN6307328.1 hypothetical protein [Psychrobacter sp.]